MQWPQLSLFLVISGHKWSNFPYKWVENVVILYSILFGQQKLQQLQSRSGVWVRCLDQVSRLGVQVKEMIYTTDLMDKFSYGKDVIWWRICKSGSQNRDWPGSSPLWHFASTIMIISIIWLCLGTWDRTQIVNITNSGLLAFISMFWVCLDALDWTQMV